MVNTVRLSAVALATLINVAFVAGSGNLLSLNTEVDSANDTDLMPDADLDLDFDYGSSIEERRKCRATKKCSDDGGSCIKSQANCDGKEDPGSCKGKKCKCCIPYKTTCPPCPTVPDCPTTQHITTTAVSVPAGFEVFNGRIIRRTKSSDPKSSSHATSMTFCDQYKAKPFIPLTVADHQLYKAVRATLGQTGYMWLPADDKRQEGTLRWYNGDVATNLSRWEWSRGKDMAVNSEAYDCLFYGTGTGGHGVNTGGRVVHMIGCNQYTSYPPICEII